MDLNLKGKVAIVTGAGGYVGREIALRLAQEGADVVVADKEMERKITPWSILEGANKVASEVQSLKRKALAVKVDTTKMQEADQMVKAALDKFGKIDILVNAAGGGARDKASPLGEQPDELWDHIVAINIKGTRNCCRAVINHMLERKSGKIVNIASGAAFGSPRETAYSAGKAAVIAFTMTLAKEVGLSGVRVNAVSPGPVGHAINPDTAHVERDKRALGRQGKPEEVGDLVAFLASDKGDFINGRHYQMGGIL